MKNFILILSSILLLTSCEYINSTGTNASEPRASLIEKDQKELEKNANSYKILFYRYAKIGLRSSIQKEDNSPLFTLLKPTLRTITEKLTKYNSQSIEPKDLLTIYADYQIMKKSISEIDEDRFPTLTEVFEAKKNDFKFLIGDEKTRIQNREHVLLSAFALLTKDLGNGIALYETSKIDTMLFSDGEERALLHFFKGFLFHKKGLYYLSEKELSHNIEWLNNKPNTNLIFTKKMLGSVGFTDEQTQLGFHSMNHIFRGFDRIMMGTEADRKLGLEDFEDCIDKAKKLGLGNKLIWAIKSYVYINQGEKEKAIQSLEELKPSFSPGSMEQETIDKTINLLKMQESGLLPNSLFDKAFLERIFSKYVEDQFAQVDLKQIINDQKIPYSKELLQTYNSIDSIYRNIEDYTNLDLDSVTEVGVGAGKKLKEEGEKIWKKIKGLLNK